MQNEINKVLGADDAPFRFYFIPDGKTMAQLYLNEDLIGETEKLLSWGQGRAEFLPKRVKLFSDGAIYSQAMQMLDGYTDGHTGEWMMEPDAFASAFRKYWDAGYQLHVHQNGDEGLEMVLDNLEQNMRRNPRRDHRTLIIHFGFSTPEQVIRAQRLGAMVSANPYYVTALANRYSDYGLGPERAHQMVRLGAVERAGIPISLHSDMPMAPCRPLFLVQCAVTRRTVEGNVVGPDQRISLATALKGITTDAALHLGLEDEVGSIEVGKRANFTVLEENPLDVPLDQLSEIEVWGTVEE
jgi:predicted amidohydrolase YtcJ